MGTRRIEDLLVEVLETAGLGGSIGGGSDGGGSDHGSGGTGPWPPPGATVDSPDRWRARFATGDRRAFADLVRALGPRVRATLVRLVGSRDDADDLTQETFVRAWRRREQFDGRGSVEGWLLRIAVHLARDHQRRTPRPSLALDAERDRDRGPGPESVARRRELERALRLAIAALPQRLRAPLVLRVIEERPYDEVARILDLAPGTVRIQVMKARRRLARALESWIGPGSGQGPESSIQNEEERP